jgi:hypothetical protein
MSLSTLMFIGVLVAAWLAIKIAPKLLVRQIGRIFAGAVGKHALEKVPDQITISRVATPQWKDAIAIQNQAAPLVRSGFNDLGTYSVDKMPGVLMRILFQPQSYVSAQLFEHPKAGNWIELATRYSDGSSDFLTTLPDQGITPPPFVRTVRADRSTSSDSLYQQHLRQRKPTEIKPVNPNDVVHEFEEAYLRYMVWKNNKGMRPEEVAAVVQKWAKAKQQGAARS